MVRICSAATALVVGASTALPAASAPAPRAPEVARAIGSAVQACGTDRACAADAVDRALDSLGARIPGPAGPAAWLRLAAALRGDRLAGVPLPRMPLRDAILALYRDARVRVDRPLRARLEASVRALPAGEASAVADLVNSMLAAGRLAAEATRGSGIEAIAKDPARALLLATVAGSAPLGRVTPDLAREWRSVEAALARVDIAKMTAAALVMAEAVARLDPAVLADDIDLPFIFVGGEGDTVHAQDRLLLVDISGNDTYTNNAGGGLFSIIGGSLAIDFGDGADRYARELGAQGWGLGAAGILYDEGGSDSYSVTQFGQGSSLAGVGVLYDAGGGDDRYLSPALPNLDPIGTKAATLGGVGLLVDEGGSDIFRQDGLDGLIWGAAGGLALLASLGDGDDTYRADAIEVDLLGTVDTYAGPIQVSAEVHAAAILYEEGGGDSYVCGARVRQGCQGAAGGAGSLGLLWDLDGNDSYWMGDTASVDLDELIGDISPLEHPVFPMGQGIGYGVAAPGSGTALGVLRDEGGSDRYTATRWAQGYGTFGALGILYDTGGGADAYEMRAPLVGSRADGGDWIDGIVGLGLDR